MDIALLKLGTVPLGYLLLFGFLYLSLLFVWLLLYLIIDHYLVIGIWLLVIIFYSLEKIEGKAFPLISKESSQDGFPAKVR